MTSDDGGRTPGESQAPPRYCAGCGEIFTAAEARCPYCGGRWTPSSGYLGVGALAAMLDEFHGLRGAGMIGPSCYATLRAVYERRLTSVRPPRLRPMEPMPVLSRPPVPAAPLPAAPPARPSRPVGVVVAEWTAKRQADILLYLGAFFLSIAALIFVGYTGTALGGVGRFSLLLAYTAGFLGIGFYLPRWERVREAAAVFLALGAVLVPLNFIALRVQVLGEGQIPNDVIWLAGSAITATLYFTLAVRGYGRLYALPGAAATLVVWGALAAVLGLPDEWFGTWFVLGAVLAHTAAPALRLPGERWIAGGARALALLGLLYAHTAALSTADGRASLPLAYALITAALAIELALRPARMKRALLPTTVALTALTGWWAAFGLDAEWYGCFAVLAASGYLLLAHRDGEARPGVWGITAAAMGALGLYATHSTVAVAGANHIALPAAYLLVLALVTTAFALRRWREALVAVPPLGVALAASTMWAAAAPWTDWLGAWVALGGIGYLATAEWDTPRLTWWRAGAAAAAAVALYQAHVAALFVGVQAAELPLTYAIVLAGVAWDASRRRDPGLLLLPSLGVGLAVTTLWAARGMTLTWLGCWLAVAGLGYLVVAELDRARQQSWRTIALVAGGAGLLWAHAAVRSPGADALVLPLTYSIVLAGVVWDGIRRRDAGLLALPAVAATCVSTWLWAAGVGAEWWLYPGLAAGFALLAGAHWWEERPVLGGFGWLYLLVPALVLPPAFEWRYQIEPVHGVVTHLLAATLVLVTALRARGRVLQGLVAGEAADESVLRSERLLLVWASAAGLLAAAAYLNAWIGVEDSARAWVFAALGTVGWLGAAWPEAARRRLVELVAPSALVAMALAGMVAGGDPATVTVVLALGTVGPALAFAASGRWVLAAVAAVFGACGVGFGWEWGSYDATLLPLVYATAAAIFWGGLAPLRRYEADERGTVLSMLSWGPWVVALAAAYVLLARRMDTLPRGASLELTREWAVLALTLAASAAALTAEGAWLKLRAVWISGTVGLLVAGLLGIAVAQPENVQAYTLPVGVYLIGSGLSFRRSEPLFGRHMSLHEAVMVVGMLCLALPPAEQSFAPGGSGFGFEVIALGLVLLGLGLMLSARWLAAGGVLALSGAGLRTLIDYSTEVPIWLTFGIVGTVLLAVGMTLLGQRERWERARRRIARWWLEPPVERELPEQV